MLRAGLLLLLLLGVTPLAWSACTISTTAGTFGTVTSFAVNGTVQSTTGTLIVQCDRVLGLLTNDSVTMRVTGASATLVNRAALKRTDNTAIADVIPIQVCGASACASSSEVTINTGSYTWNATALLGLLGQARYAIPIYLRTVPGQSVSAGTYQVTVNLSVDYNICSVGALGLCGTPQAGTLLTSLVVNMNITNDCTAITAPNVNFGSAPVVQNFNAVTQSVAVTCTKGSVYTLGISNGSYANGSVRNMANGSNRLSYEIYKGSTANRWGVSGAERWTSTDSSQVSTDGVLRTYNYTARVLTTQTTPPAGNYSDTLVVDIAF
nr:spore coat U domain-containing protein [uncultured Enterobacter sp.]